MPKKINWDNILNKAWLYTKIFFVSGIICAMAFSWGTFNPNKWSKAKVNAELEHFYLEKIKDLDLREPEFTYNDDIQFVRAMHKCIDYINFTTPKDQRVPWEMIIGQAALESGWGKSRFAVKGNNLFGIRTFTETVPHLKPSGVEIKIARPFLSDNVGLIYISQIRFRLGILAASSNTTKSHPLPISPPGCSADLPHKILEPFFQSNFNICSLFENWLGL